MANNFEASGSCSGYPPKVVNWRVSESSKSVQSQCWKLAVPLVQNMSKKDNSDDFFGDRFIQEVQECIKRLPENYASTLKGNAAELAAICIIRSKYSLIRDEKSEECYLKNVWLLDPEPRLAGIQGACMTREEEAFFLRQLPWFKHIKRTRHVKAKSFDILSIYTHKNKRKRDDSTQEGQPLYVLTQVKYKDSSPAETFVFWEKVMLKKSNQPCNVRFWWFTFSKKVPTFFNRYAPDDKHIRTIALGEINHCRISDVCKESMDIQHRVYQPKSIDPIPMESFGTLDGYQFRVFQWGILHHITKAIEECMERDVFPYNFSTVQHCGCGKTISFWAVLHWFYGLTRGINVLLTPRLVLSTQSCQQMHEWDIRYGYSRDMEYYFIGTAFATLNEDTLNDWNDENEDSVAAAEIQDDGDPEAELIPENEDAFEEAVKDFMTHIKDTSQLKDILLTGFKECNRPGSTKKILLVCTYQSCAKLVQAYHGAMEQLVSEGMGFDVTKHPFFGLVGLDEAQMACGYGYQGFKSCHLLPSSLQLSMTATPKSKFGISSMYSINKLITESNYIDHGEYSGPPPDLSRKPFGHDNDGIVAADMYIPLAVKIRDENASFDKLGTHPACFYPLVGEPDELEEETLLQEWPSFADCIRFIEGGLHGTSVEVFAVKEYAQSSVATIYISKVSEKLGETPKTVFLYILGRGKMRNEKIGISEDADGKCRLWRADSQINRDDFVNRWLSTGLLYTQGHYFGMEDVDTTDGHVSKSQHSGIGKIVHVVPQSVAITQGVIVRDNSYAMDLSFLREDTTEHEEMLVQLREIIGPAASSIEEPAFQAAIHNVAEEISSIHHESSTLTEQRVVSCRDIIKVSYILKVFMEDMREPEVLNSKQQNSETLPPVIRPLRRMLIRCESVKQALMVKFLLQAMSGLFGIRRKFFIDCLYRSSISIKSKQSYTASKKLISEFKNTSKYQFGIMTTFRLVEVGWDCPIIDSVCAYCPILNIHSYIQFRGRAARASPESGKETYDFFYCIEADHMTKQGNTSAGSDSEEEMERNKRKAILSRGSNEAEGFLRMADMMSYIDDDAIKIMCTFESLKSQSSREDNPEHRYLGQKGVLTKRSNATGASQADEDDPSTNGYFLLTEEESRKIVDNIRRVRFYVESKSLRKETSFWLQVLQDYANELQRTDSLESDTCALKVPKQRFKYTDTLLYTDELKLGRTVYEWIQYARGKKSIRSEYLENYYRQILCHDVRKIFRQPSADWWKSDEVRPDRQETTPFWLKVFQHYADEQVRKGKVAKNGEIIRPVKENKFDNSWDDVILGKNNLQVGNTLDHWKQAARGKENGRNEETKAHYAQILSSKVKCIFRMKSDTWWEARYSRQEKLKAFDVRWRRDHTKDNFQWIPNTSAEENEAVYDLGNGKGPQGGFRLGDFVTNQIYQYKQGKKTKDDMQELVDAMHLEENESELKSFWDRCVREIAQPHVTPEDKIKALEVRWTGGLLDPPTKAEDTQDPKYDIGDGKGLRGGFNLGAFVSNKVSRYKKKTQVDSDNELEAVVKKLNPVMEELEQAMHLEGDRLQQFREKYARKELPESS